MKTKEMKLLESAKDLKMSCYIYFLIRNESSTYSYNEHSLLPIFEYTYNIQTTQLKGCAILQIRYK